MTKRKERPFLNGMCYVYYYTMDELCPVHAAEEMEKLGVKSVRIWQHITWLLEDADTVKREVADRYHEMYRVLLAHGIEQTVAMNHYWLFPEEALHGRECSCVYDRDLTEGSLYREFLDLYERSWHTMVREFPEVTDWEVGNELNHKAFLKRMDGTDFSWAERIDIMTDLMQRACRAVRAENPAARVVMPGLAPVSGDSEGVIAYSIAAEYSGINESMERVYQNIESGAWGTTDPRDFFDALCWHPYYAKQNEKGEWYWAMPDDDWVELNRSIYEIAEKHGDGGIPCVLSEYGCNDWGAEDDESLVPITRAGFSLIREKMPFVSTVHAYRLCDSLGYVTDAKDTYSFYRLENGKLHAKKRAYELQNQYGGQGDLSR